MISPRISFLALLVLLMVIPGCQYQLSTLSATFFDRGVPYVEQPPAITIWIHGTRLLPQGMFNNFFYCHQGLHHFSCLADQFHIRKIVQELSRNHSERFPASHCYIFGWSGKLSGSEREKAARELYESLKTVRIEYRQKYGGEPRIQIITHSHGGNVALNIARVKDSDDSDFTIDQLVLLACPVQKNTQGLVHDPVFRKIYSFYSTMDMLQVLDPQGLKIPGKGPLFSQRIFPQCDKVVQVRLKCDGRGLLHIDFILCSFIHFLGSLLDEVDSWCQEGSTHPRWHSSNKVVSIDTKKREFHKYLSSR